MFKHRSKLEIGLGGVLLTMLLGCGLTGPGPATVDILGTVYYVVPGCTFGCQAPLNDVQVSLEVCPNGNRCRVVTSVATSHRYHRLLGAEWDGVFSFRTSVDGSDCGDLWLTYPVSLPSGFVSDGGRLLGRCGDHLGLIVGYTAP